jgi:malate dehydrogenase
MERADLLEANAGVFREQGTAINKNADLENFRAVVVGNPANTNAYILNAYAPDLDPSRVTAMTRLDHNRGLAQLAEKTGCTVNDIQRFAIWGNHSATQYPDLSHTQIKGQWAKDVLNDEKWIRNTFIPNVQQRGAAIIEARGASSAASAASSAIDHMRDWVHGTNGEWTSMGVFSDGSYGATPGTYFSYPVVCSGGNYSIVQNVPIDPYSAEKIEASNKELTSEALTINKAFPEVAKVNAHIK